MCGSVCVFVQCWCKHKYVCAYKQTQGPREKDTTEAYIKKYSQSERKTREVEEGRAKSGANEERAKEELSEGGKSEGGESQ